MNRHTIKSSKNNIKAIAIWAGIVMTIGLALSIAGFIELQKITQERLFVENEKNARNQIEKIQTHINISLDSLTNVAALYQAAGDITTQQLKQVFDNDTHYHQGTLGLAWVPAIPASDVDAFQSQIQKEEGNDYHIYEITGHGLPRPVAKTTEYFPVRSVYPLLATDLRLGLNLATMASRKHVMDTAAFTQQTAITNQLSIFNHDSYTHGFQAFHPLFSKGDKYTNHLLGYVVGIYDLNALFSHLFNPSEAILTVYDGSSQSQQLLFSSSTPFSDVTTVKKSPLIHWTFPLQVADKQWIVTVFPQIKSQQGVAASVPYLGLIIGSLITSLLTIYLVIALIRSKQVTELNHHLIGTTHQLDTQRRLREEADQANAAKSNLLRAASHDLRQPLHTIGLISALLADTDDKQQQLVLTQKLMQAVKNMENLFGALLDISLLEAGKLQVHTDCFAINALIDKLYLEFETQTEEKNLALRTVESSAVIETDPTLLEQILRNLLSNALRYTLQGKVLIGCRRKAGYLRICVIDTGIGMSLEAQQHISEDFYRDTTARQLVDKGLGLGLSIVSKTTETLGLTFGFTSEQGKGSCFYIDVPYAQRHHIAPQIQTPIVKGMLNGVVWVIEDDDDTRFGLEKHLHSWGLQCKTFANSTELNIELNRTNRCPDWILADYQLIGETGLDLVHHIEAHFKLPITTLFITASIELEEQLHGYDIMLKPCKPDELYQWLNLKNRADN